MTTPLLEVRALSCEREERLLFSELNFCVNAGSIVQVAGPNGSGKTTMLRALAGLSERCRGDILWRGQDIARVAADYRSQYLYLGSAGRAVCLARARRFRGPAGGWL